MQQQREDGKIMAAVGASRCGKSTIIKAVLKKRKRILVSDPKGTYGEQMGFEKINDRAELVNRLESTSDGDLQVVFRPFSRKDFDFVCDLAFNWNVEKPMTFVAEELAQFASAGRATGAWGRCVNQGLEYGINILGAVQRGQEVDKTILNNATFLHIMQHKTDTDALYMASMLGVPIEKIPREPMRFIQWSSDAGLICEGGSKYKANGDPEFRIDGKLKGLDENGLFKGVKY